MPARTLTLDDRLKSISTIFDQAQNTTANHSKNFVALYKVHLEAAKVSETVKGGEGIKLTGERAFEDVIIDVSNRVLVIKKGETVADRVVKFLGGYIKFGKEKGKHLESRSSTSDLALAADAKPKDEDEEDDEGSPISRLAIRLMRHLLKGCMAKDKVVRYRCVQILAEIMGSMDEIE